MTGNTAFADFVTGQGNNFRVTHQEDIVPKLPGYVLGYAHISDEYWITSDNNVVPTPQTIQVSSGAINLSGDEGTLGSSVSNHHWYFNAITSCYNDSLEI